MVGSSNVLVGTQWGDEGKIRVLDKLIEEFFNAIIATFCGGPNGGHTLEAKDKKIVLHQIPAGIFYPDTLLYVGSGCVLNPGKMNQEIAEVNALNINLERRLNISSNVTVIQPHHILLDEIYGWFIGTTKNGIGPAYADQAIRAVGKDIRNLKLGDYLADPRRGKEIARKNLFEVVKTIIPQLNSFDELIDLVDKNISNVDLFDEEIRKLEPYLSKDPLFMVKQVQAGKNVIFSGSQSTKLDRIRGITPFTTSSGTTANDAYKGGDLPLIYHRKNIGVAKAIMSRVGNGPFISEFGGQQSESYCAENGGKAHTKEIEREVYDTSRLLNSNNLFELGIALRIIGNEYGATTKRPRRIGMLDLVSLKEECLLNAINELYINKFDCLTDFGRTSLPGIPLVTGYELDGQRIDYTPTNEAECRKVKPIVEYLPFIPNISGIRDYHSLPIEAQNLIQFIEKKVGTKINGIGVGPERDQFVFTRTEDRN